MIENPKDRIGSKEFQIWSKLLEEDSKVKELVLIYLKVDV